MLSQSSCRFIVFHFACRRGLLATSCQQLNCSGCLMRVNSAALMSTVPKTETRVDPMTGKTTTTIHATKKIHRNYGSTSSLDDLPRYRSVVAPRNTTVISRSSAVPTGGVITRTVEYGRHLNLQPQVISGVAVQGANDMQKQRAQEKKDLQGLNERLANYIDRVRFLEAQNKKLADELNDLRDKWGKDTEAVKLMYGNELKQLRTLVDDTEKEKARLELQNQSLQDQLNEANNRCDELQRENSRHHEKILKQDHQLSEYEAEIAALRRRLAAMEEERGQLRQDVARLTQELSKLRIDLDQETLNHIDAENRRQTAEEELAFLKNVHEQELKELSALAYRDTTIENREFWNSEVGSALSEMQAEFDNRLAMIKNEMETYYNVKITEYSNAVNKQSLDSNQSKEENKKLKTVINELKNKLGDMETRNALLEKQLADLQRELSNRDSDFEKERLLLREEMLEVQNELDRMRIEFDNLVDKKLSLELEIAAYRKLLEGAENRLLEEEMSDSTTTGTGSSLNELIARRIEQQIESDDTQIIKGEMSAKTRYQRSAKGPISIGEVNPDGKWIIIENTGKKEENLEGWSIRRKVDNKREYSFVFPRTFIKPGSQFSVKIFAKGDAPNKLAAGEFEIRENNWGIGSNVNTHLYNEKGEERASHIQKTVYTY